VIQVDNKIENQFLGYKILCYYANLTNKIQITRIKNTPDLSFERVVFPGERILFESIPEADLEVYVSTMGKEMLSHKVMCDRLRVREDSAQLALSY
jgi:Domain of unknown function (DUF1830)